MSTPHNEAKVGDFAQGVLLPGDPLRAEWIAREFLDHARPINRVRNMLAFTGRYRDREVSVMGTGMGVPSMGICAHELIHHYGVKTLLRIGSAGAYQKDLKLKDLLLAVGASTDSAFAQQFELPGSFSATADFELLGRAYHEAKRRGISVRAGDILTSDVFYEPNSENRKRWSQMGILAVEMETFALYTLAKRARVKALSLLTVSDSLITGEGLSPEERQTAFSEMVEVALETLKEE